MLHCELSIALKISLPFLKCVVPIFKNTLFTNNSYTLDFMRPPKWSVTQILYQGSVCQLLSLILPFTFSFSFLFGTLWHLLIFVWISPKLLKKKRKRKPNKQNVIKHQKTEWLSNYPMITIDLLGEIFPFTCQRLYDWQNYWLGAWNEEHLSIWSIFF